MGKATQDLRNEHEAIIHVLDILAKVLEDQTQTEAAILTFGRELVSFLKTFADKCHHGKEEGFLFVELVQNGLPNEGGPIGVMLKEHRQGREHIASMSEALEAQDLAGFKTAALQYRFLLINHIAKENNVLFPMADKLLNDTTQDELFRHFEEHEETVIGHGVHDELHAMIHRWEQKFGV